MSENVICSVDAGGYAVLSAIAGATLNGLPVPRDQKLMRIASENKAEPRQIAIQILAIAKNDNPLAVDANQKLTAVIEANTGRGVMTARVDVGTGATFTVCANSVDVGVVLESSRLDQALVAGDSIQVYGSLAPATSTQPRAARVTQRVQLAAGVASAIYAVPAFANSVTLKSNDPTKTAGITIRQMTVASVAGSGIQQVDTGAAGAIPWTNGASYFQLISAADVLATMAWDLWL